MLLAILLFSLMQVLVKKMDNIPFYELIFFRAVISVVICYFAIKKRGIPFFGKRKDLLVARGLFGCVSLCCFFYATQNMPYGSVITIVNIKPFLVLLWATLFLGERTKWFQWLFFGVSLVGIWFLKSFDSRLEVVPLLATLGAAFFASGAYTLLRKLRESDEPIVILFYFTFITTPIVLPFVIMNWVTPQGIEWILCLAIGLLTHFAQLAMTKAYQLAEVGVVSNFYYLGIALAFLFGYWFFGETYSVNQVYAVLVILSGILLNVFFSFRERSKSL